MLDLELDLEADLGVDTVKQAETFAAVREAYDIQRQENLQPARLPDAAAAWCGFVYDSRPDLKPSAPAAQPTVAGDARRRRKPGCSRCGAPRLTAPSNPVAQKVLEIVAEKTGYPSDMLELDLDLEADLGVDTVKQAETFAAVREAYDIPRQENLRLRDFPTLRSVVQVRATTRRPGPGSPVAAALPCAGSRRRAVAVATAPLGVRSRRRRRGPGVVQKVLAIVAEKTGYPQDMLELDLDLEADLGVDTVKQAETFAAVREAYGIARQENLKLRDFPTLRSVVGFVYQFRPDLKPAPPTRLGAVGSAGAGRRSGRRQPAARSRRAAGRAVATRSCRRCWRSSPRRPAIRRTCWSWTSISRRTSASTR